MDQLWALEFAGAEDGYLGEGAADHGYFVAGVEARAGLAVFVDFVGHGGAVGYAEAEVVEEVGHAGEEADGEDGVVFGFVDEGFEEEATGSVAFVVGVDDDGTDFGEVRAVEMEGAAAEELSVALGYGEVANVFTDFGEAAAEKRAVSGKGIDEVVDVAGVLEAGFAGLHGEEVVRHRGPP